MVNKGTTHSKLGMAVVREIFWWPTLFNFTIRAVHIPGKLNIIADHISRLHKASSLVVLQHYLDIRDRVPFYQWVPYLLCHMSLGSLLSVFQAVKRAIDRGVSRN